MDSQINDTELTKFGSEITRLIKAQKYEEIANIFGYALAFGNNPADVISSEIINCLSKAGNNARLSTSKNGHINVKYFKPNSTKLLAVVECTLAIENGTGELLVELIAAGSGVYKNVYLEEISYKA